LAGTVIRYGVRTDSGRRIVADLVDGLSIGRFGKLEVSGLGGDLFGDLTVKRVAIRDRDGVWLEARDVGVKYRFGELLQRRFHAERITAGLVQARRRPNPEPPTGEPEKPLPVAVDIDSARLRLETLPALSQRRGLFDVSAQIDMARAGPWTGRVNAASLLRAGDGLDAAFRVKDDDRFLVNAKAVEAGGGAIAGAIGLSADQPFRLDVRANGGEAGGELFLLAQSGNQRPAEATGRWSKAGGQVRGRVALAASTLTRQYAEWFGPELTFSANGRRLRTDVYDLRLQAQAENASLTAEGPLNSKTRASTEGLRVRASMQDVSRLVPTPAIGPTTVEGLLKGSLDAFVLDGSIEAQRVALPQYGVARAAGPLRIERRRGDINIETDLTGAGGAGEGLYAALLGRAPTAKATVSRLADGRVLIRSLEARGPGLSVDAEGSRGILGDLSFRGEATLSNLANAAPRARGSLSGSWSARQGRSGSPWEFTFDGRGRGFGSGLPELDRLLGAQPRLRLAGEYLSNGDTRIERASLDGAAASATAEGVLARGGGLNFDVDWRAQGPFGAGPVEITGRATGDGRIGGTIAAPRAELVANFDAIDFGQLVVTPARLTLTFATTPAGFDGRFALNGGSTYGPASASAGFRFVEGGVDLNDAALDAGGVRANGDLALRNGAPSSADLTFAAGPGAFLVRGTSSGALRLTDGGGGPRATLSLTGDDLVVRGAENNPIERVRLTADGPLSRLPFQISIAAPKPVPASFDGTGLFVQAGGETSVTLQGRGKAQDVAFNTVEPILVRIAGANRSVRGRLAVGGGQAFIDARQTGQTVNALATLDGVEIATFNADFAGRTDARLTLTGQGARLTGALNATVDNARSLDAPDNLAVDGRIQATLNDNRIQVSATAANPAGLQARTNLSLPVEASAQPLRLAINRTQPIRGDFAADGELRSLWDLFFGAERTLSGRLTAQGTIAGTLNEPRANGVVNVAGGRFRDAQTGLELRDLTLNADLANTAIVVRTLTANDGQRGTLSGQGRIGLTRGAASTFRLDLTRFHFLDSEIGEATASGRVEVARDERGENTLTGALRVDEAEIAARAPNAAGVVTIDVVEINKPGATGVQGAPAAAGAARGPAVKLDVSIDAPRGIFIRGQGIDLEVSLDARVRGTTAEPILTGEARVVRGTFEFAGKRFEFDDRGTVRLSTDPENIRLNLTAVRDDPALTAEVRVTGTAAKPIVTLSSQPQLPQDEILSQVLFGRSASQLTPIEAAQLAAALASIATGGGFDVIGNLRSFAGLDRLALGGGTAGTTIAGGKYLTDDVYLEIIGGGREGPVAEVEWRVRRNFSLISRVGGETGARLSVRYRRQSKEAPDRQAR
jgi:translocation and assembly module TamB